MTLLASLLASLEARPLLILSLLSFLDLFAVASVTSAIGAHARDLGLGPSRASLLVSVYGAAQLGPT